MAGAPLRGALLAVAFLGAACSNKSRSPQFVTPVGQEVPADRITLAGTAPAGAATVTAGDVAALLAADRSYRARNVPLVRGENAIEVTARDGSGRELRRETVRIVAVGGDDPVRLLVDPPSGAPPLAVRLRALSPHRVVEAQFDFEGDGTADVAGPALEVDHTYTEAGRYPPQVTVRTASGLLFSSLPATPISPEPLVLALPEPSVAGSVAVATPERLVRSPAGELAALARSGREVVVLNADLSVARRVGLRGVDDPSGLAFDVQGRILTCDAARHRVVRLTRSGQLDASFNFRGYVGEAGSDPAQFRDPADLAVDEEGNIYVADAGNRRIQKLNSEGVFVAEFAVAGEPQRLSYFQGGLHYGLAGSSDVVGLDVLGREQRRFAARGSGSLRCVAVLPDLGIFATAADGDGTIWLQAFGGTARRALRVPEITAPLAVALGSRADRLELVVADAAGQVVRLTVPEDPPAATPDRVVAAMLQHLADGDLEAALALFHAEVRDRYRWQLGKLTAAQRAALQATVQVGAVVAQSDNDAEVAVTAEVAGQTLPDVVGLRREPATFAWRIDSF